jgi:anti-sigma factor ChrR (cupin superfamily)
VSAQSPATACFEADRVHADALGVLAPDETRALASHLESCAECRALRASLGPVVDALVDWPTDVLRPSPSLREALARRVAPEAASAPTRVATPVDAGWREVAPGISCSILSTDAERGRVVLLVKLAPNVDYPPHTHGGVEELHLLDGELWIDDRKLYPGDFNRAEPGTADKRVWSETGCTCFLVTSPADALG